MSNLEKWSMLRFRVVLFFSFVCSRCARLSSIYGRRDVAQQCHLRSLNVSVDVNSLQLHCVATWRLVFTLLLFIAYSSIERSTPSFSTCLPSSGSLLQSIPNYGKLILGLQLGLGAVLR